MQYCTMALEQRRKVWSIAVLHFIVVIIGSEYCSIAVLERVLQYCIGERFGVAVSPDQREPMLPSRRILCKLPCAFSHLLHTLYRSIVSLWIRGPGLPWRHTVASQPAFRHQSHPVERYAHQAWPALGHPDPRHLGPRSGHGSHQITPRPSMLTKLKRNAWP